MVLYKWSTVQFTQGEHFLKRTFFGQTGSDRGQTGKNKAFKASRNFKKM